MFYSCQSKRKKVVGGDEFRFSSGSVGNLAENVSNQCIVGDHVSPRVTLESKAERLGNNSASPFNVELFKKYKLHKPYFPGSPKTKFDALIMIMTYVMRHKSSGVATQDLVELANELAGEEIIPASDYMIGQLLCHNANIVYHYYCRKCKTYVGAEKKCKDDTISVCPNTLCNEAFTLHKKNDGCYFVYLFMGPQIVKILEEPGLTARLILWRNRQTDEGSLEDIGDGIMYQEYLNDGIIEPGEVLTVTVSSDGAQSVKNSAKAVWPILIRVNELPPEERYSPNRILTAGLWHGGEPIMSTFFVPFIQEAKQLQKTGITWTDPETGLKRCTKVLAVNCIADSVARPMLQRRLTFHGYGGCGYCTHPGEMIGGAMKYKQSAGNYPERTNKTIRANQAEAESNKAAVSGELGYSAFYPLKHFHFPWALPAEPLHYGFEGMQKRLLELWCDSIMSAPYHLSLKDQEIVDSRLLAIRPPSNILKPARSLFDKAHFKANEWRPFCFFYGIVCLSGVMEEKYLKHYALFVSAMYILYKARITKEEVIKADEMLQEFVRQFEILYGAVNMRFNVHLLTHIGRMVALWGPLWTSSGFDLEGKNKYLLDQIHGSRCFLEQIAKKSTIHANISSIIFGHDLVSPKTRDFCEKLISFRRLKYTSACDQATLVGCFKAFYPGDEENEALSSHGVSIKNSEFLTSWEKIIFNGFVFACDNETTKHNDSLAKLKNGKYCRIILFFRNPIKFNELLFFGRPIDLHDPQPRDAGSVDHIKECTLNCFREMAVFRVQDIRHKSLLMKVDFRHYVSDLPNSFEKD